MKFCGDLIKSIDYFGVRLGFRINNREVYGSCIGGCLFIFYAVVAILFVLISTKIFIEKETFNVINIDKSFNPAKLLNLSDHQFAFAMRIDFENGTSLEDTSLSNFFVSRPILVKKINGKYIKESIEHHPCTKSDFYHLANSTVFQEYPMNSFTCFGNRSDLVLQGGFTNPNMSYIEYQVEVNNTLLERDYQYIVDVFTRNQFRLNMYYSNPLIDLSNKNSPVFFELAAINTYLDLKVVKRNNIDFQQFIFEDDQNLLVDHYSYQNYMKLKQSRLLFVNVVDRENSPLEDKFTLLRYYIRAENMQRTIKRSYKKLGHFIAELSALLVNCLVGIGVVMFFVNSMFARQSVMKKVMKFSDSIVSDTQAKNILEDIRGQNNTMMSPSRTIRGPRASNKGIDRSPRANNLSRESTVRDQGIYVDDEQQKLLDGEKTNVGNNLKFGLCDLFCYYLCCGRGESKAKRELFIKAEKNYFYNVDITTYMKKMQELDILKFMLLDEETLKIMNFISKPGVSYIDIKNKKVSPFFYDGGEFNKESNHIDELKAVRDTYKHLKSRKDELTAGEKKILSLFEDQVDEIVYKNRE